MFSEQMSWLDPAVIILYLIVSLLLGFFGSRLLGMRNDKEEDFFLAGKKMPGWLGGISFASTALNTDVAPVYCGVAVAVGLSGSWFFLSRFGLALLIASILFAVRWRQMNIKTGPEFLQLRYAGGSKYARVYASAMSVFFGMIPWIGAGLIGMHKVAGPIFEINRWLMLAIILPVLLIYVWNSGLAGVLVTDAMQGFVILGANLVMVFAVLYAFGGPSGLADGVRSAFPDNGETILSVLPDPANQVLSPWTILAWGVIVTMGAGSGVAADGQRIFACRSDREGAKVGIWGTVFLFAMLLMLMLPSLGIMARHPELYTASPGDREMAYGMMLTEFLPKGAIGLTVAGLLAAVMSTISTHLNYGSQTLLNDVYRPLAGEPKPGREVWIGRLMMLFIAACSIAVFALADSLLNIATVVLGLFGSSALFGWAQWWWWRINFKCWIASVIGGPPVYLLCYTLLPRIPWWQEQIALSAAREQNMLLFQAVIAMGISAVIWVIVVLCTRPEPMERLKEFYLRARPMGAWGPVRRQLIAEGKLADAPARPLLAKGFGVAVAGFITIASGVLAIDKFYVGDWRPALLFSAAALLAGAGFKYLFNWYIGLLTAKP